MDNFRQSFSIGDTTTWWCCRFQLLRDFLIYWFILWCPSFFFILYHNTLPYLITFCFDLAAQNLHTEVLGLNLNVSKIWWSVLFALGFFTVTDFLSYIGLFSVNSLVVVTIDALIMELYCCWSLHFPEDLYNFLILSRHLCSYIALLLNGWSNTMVTICTSIQYNLEN